MRKSPPLQVEEIGGDHYPDLEAAQTAALKNMASDLAELMRLMLAEGELIIEKGRIVPNRGRTPVDE